MEELTERERLTLELAAAGATAKEIAGMMYISEKTVAAHLASSRKKLNSKNTSGAIATAIRSGFICYIGISILSNVLFTDNACIRNNHRASTRITRFRNREI